MNNNPKDLNVHNPNLARQRITKKQFVKLLVQIYQNVIWERAPACCGEPATTWYWYWDNDVYKPAGVWENGYGATPKQLISQEDNQNG